MKKKLIVGIIALVLIAGGVYYFYNSRSTDTSVSSEKISEQPDRPAEINGVIVSAQGNELVVANEINRQTLTDEEREANKESRQNLTPEEKAALREEENQEIETENVTIIVPVGVPVIGGSGEATGEMVKLDIVELTKGTYISAWVAADSSIEYVKVKGTN